VLGYTKREREREITREREKYYPKNKEVVMRETHPLNLLFSFT